MMGYKQMPKGYNSVNSPYGRKVRVAEIETQQRGLIEWTFMSREERSKEMPSINPLGKIPALILENGDLLIDSPVIASWIDDQHKNRRLIPEAIAERWLVLNLEALGDGLGDAAIAVALEASRPKKNQSDTWIMRNNQKVYQTLAFLNDQIGSSQSALNMGGIAVACAIGYMELREVATDWRKKHSRLADWYDTMQQRDSFKETAIDVKV